MAKKDANPLHPDPGIQIFHTQLAHNWTETDHYSKYFNFQNASRFYYLFAGFQ